jgi:adenylate kinase family enzyme
LKPIDLTQYSHIILVGSAGSGKSWLSKRIAEITGYPLFHLDNEFWLPGWEKPPKDKWLSRQQEIINGSQWIIDGNYNSSMELRFAAADLVIFLDINRFICVWRVIMRTGKKRSDLPGYLKEPHPYNKEFIEFCKWIWSFYKTGRKTITNLHAKYPEKEFLQLSSRREVRKLLSGYL